MLLVEAEKTSVHLRCAILIELLDELSTIPVAFFHASNTISVWSVQPLANDIRYLLAFLWLHHLAHVGHLLGSVVQTPLSAWTYLQVRNILLVLADFFEKIESTGTSSPGLATKIKAQITRIDECMRKESQQIREPGLPSMGLSLLSNWSNVTPFGSFNKSHLEVSHVPLHKNTVIHKINMYI